MFAAAQAAVEHDQVEVRGLAGRDDEGRLHAGRAAGMGPGRSVSSRCDRPQGVRGRPKACVCSADPNPSRSHTLRPV